MVPTALSGFRFQPGIYRPLGGDSAKIYSNHQRAEARGPIGERAQGIRRAQLCEMANPWTICLAESSRLRDTQNVPIRNRLDEGVDHGTVCMDGQPVPQGACIQYSWRNG